MGRGLGERQREVLDRLAAAPPGEWVPVHELADDPDDPAAMARVRSAVRGLQRRGLVTVIRMTDPTKLVDTITVHGYFDESSGRMVYLPDAAQREWYGAHVRLAGYADPDDPPRQGRRLQPMFQPAGPTA